jgi:hypothetical protein
VRRPILAAGLLLLVPAAASAVTFSGTWQASGSALADPGLVVAARGAPAFSLRLDPGQSATLPLFRIWTPEAAVGADDLVPRRLDVGIRLDRGGAGSIAGTTAGHRLAGLQWGSIDWRAPLSLAVEGGTLSVSLEDTIFAPGLLGLGRGAAAGADVRANFRYVAPVPLPPGLGLALLACAALGLVRRRARS